MFRLLIFALGIFLPPTAAPDTHHLVKLLESRYHGAQTLQATFLERYSENGQVVRSEAGIAYFRRPGKMRWEYKSPEKNLFLVDGKTAWFYVPQDHTVTRAPAKQSSDWRTPLALLAGEMKLSRVCASVSPATTEKPDVPGDVVLYCQLRGEQNKTQSPSGDSAALQSDGPEESGYLEVAPATGDLARVLVREKGGVTVEFKFENWHFNPSVPAAYFRFDVPPGVAIVNGESPAESTP
ncbi:MAG TPA: outer membrane lipoprotein carrier protein LolA [Candidatus Solibacter sp.]|nr:outer membrane lipoprotein carrier protein LolA [Candidatus Solibacter sp.]